MSLSYDRSVSSYSSDKYEKSISELLKEASEKQKEIRDEESKSEDFDISSLLEEARILQNKIRSTEAGLRLGEYEKVIKRISGPVSMYYLKPNPDVFSMYRGEINFPLLLAFGDVHRDYSNLCVKCFDRDDGDLCLKIYDHEFLKMIDRVAKHHPVDFYTESSSYFNVTSSQLIGQGVLFDNFLVNTVLPCHDAELRKKDMKAYKDKGCPTENIRWHYSDARFFYDKFEGFLINFVNKLMLFLVRF